MISNMMEMSPNMITETLVLKRIVEVYDDGSAIVQYTNGVSEFVSKEDLIALKLSSNPNLKIKLYNKSRNAA